MPSLENGLKLQVFLKRRSSASKGAMPLRRAAAEGKKEMAEFRLQQGRG